MRERRGGLQISSLGDSVGGASHWERLPGSGACLRRKTLRFMLDRLSGWSLWPLSWRCQQRVGHTDWKPGPATPTQNWGLWDFRVCMLSRGGGSREGAW